VKSGRVVESDLQILAIGQRHNHKLLTEMEPSLLSEKGSDNVRPSLQLAHLGYSNIFAIGDVANTGAINAGHIRIGQADIAVQNLVKLVEAGGNIPDSQLEKYVPSKPQIRITVGPVSRFGESEVGI
jgi:NADH dehydrogenase FAD-containing subunit